MNEETIKKLKEAICYTPYRYGEAFEMAIEALEHQPEWISVKDRLPKDNGKYLVVVCGDKIVGPYVATRFFWNGHFEEFQYFPFRHVSHWMPLPAPPKEET